MDDETLQFYRSNARAYADWAKAPSTAPSVSGQTQASAESADVNSFTKVAEITRKLYRQTNADAVMSTAVNEIGEQWKAQVAIL